MELQMKAICEGRMSKNEVIEMNLEKYREVFVRTQQQIGVLKMVSLRPFPNLHAWSTWGDA